MLRLQKTLVRTTLFKRLKLKLMLKYGKVLSSGNDFRIIYAWIFARLTTA